MKVQSSNKITLYHVSLESCTCPDFTHRKKSENRSKCGCNNVFECLKCSCKHQRDNLLILINEGLNDV